MVKGAPDGSEQATVSSLADRLQLAQSTVTELVARAEESGFIRRVASPQDGRTAFVRLTPEGEVRLARTFTRLGVERERLRRAIADP